MSRKIHLLYIGALSTIYFIVLLIIIYKGYDYYTTSLEERFFHPGHDAFRPSGLVGHGLGIAGTLMMIFGMGLYMARKRWRWMQRLGLLKHWLEFHIFLCSLGPTLILFHTAMKFGGLVAVSFWSMVAVFASGILGRFIYLQIPRTIEGRELTLQEVRAGKEPLEQQIGELLGDNNEYYEQLVKEYERTQLMAGKSPFTGYFKKLSTDRKLVGDIKHLMKQKDVSASQRHTIVRLVKADNSLKRRIERLETMQNLFRFWHVIHMPFALIMILVMLIHVGVTIAFGYRWIF
ncbi:MAG: hypothetical protein CVU06_02760 [Bacteroidetes bacterium HGW-Bacteroidetes-22]|nr:MAG: hypothetical protein CVU06_02760 [Bacteroidetes bacterium HGW-Bacteroidetes-22]